MRIRAIIVDKESEEIEIIAHYSNGSYEVIDTAETEEEAEYLKAEYQLAFGVL